VKENLGKFDHLDCKSIVCDGRREALLGLFPWE